MLREMVIDGVDVPEDSPARDHAGELLVRVAAGDRAAFGQLYDMLAPRAFGLILRVLVNRALSEEVLQDVFLEVWQSASGFAPNKGQGRSWVLTIAHRRAVDRVRSTRASTERDEKAGLRELNSGQDSVDDQVALRIESRRVARAMDAFPMRSAKHCCCRMSGDILRARSPHWWDRPWGRSRQECATVCRA
jgi:RNA polymerase sigma-70 factor (ECF subfamily)